MSESIGRLPVYQVSIPIAILFLLGSGITDHIYGIAVCRFFTGLFGGSVTSVGPGGTATDLFRPHERALPLGLFNFMGFTGPAFGFFISGLPIQYTGDWRYTAWTPLAFGVITVILLLCLKETRRDAIERRFAFKSQFNARLQNERVQDNIRRVIKLSYWTILQRPFRMLLTEPVVTAVGLYTSFSFATIYGMLAASPYIYERVYGFSLSAVSLTWLSWIVGYFFGAILTTFMQRRIVKARMSSESGRQYVPEWTLRPAMIGSPLVPVGLFWIAWTSRGSVHWIVPTIALAFYAAVSLHRRSEKHTKADFF